MVKKFKIKPFLIFFVSILTILGTLFTSNNVAFADGKELTGVVTDISVLNMSDSKLEPNSDGTYQIITNRTNQFFVQFDLKQYDGKLANGDYFDVDIPTPVTVYNGSTELYDKETKVNIGTVVVTANGDNQGGKARVTLKNLDEFQAKTGGDIVKGVKGNYAITFLFKSDQTATPLTFENKGVGKTITHTFTSKTVDGKQEGFENYAKAGDDVVSKEWTSDKLAAIGSVGKGDIYSPWRIRVNTGRQDYGKNLVLNDFLPNTAEFSAIQYIPESLVVYSSVTLDDGTSARPTDAKKMVEGTDYTVAWNENYTQFKIIFADGSKSYWVEYHTTTPGDGSKVQNVIQLTTADGTPLTRRSNITATDFKAERSSLVKGQIEASTAFKIKINKTNAFTLVPVAGAVYTVKSEDGTISTELTTNEKGVAISDEFDQKYVGQTFIIKEKTAPAGYTLDEKEYKVTLGAEGSKINLQDEPIAADFSITAKKVIAGNRPVALKDGEFKFDLYNANNLTTPIASTTNKADGSITFEGLKAKGPGTYNYVIKENTETKVPGITFDENSYEVTVVVKAEGGTLKAEVTTQAPTLTNTYEPSPARATFKATKELVGKELANEQFEFELSEGGKVIATSSNGKTVNGVEAATNEVVFSVLYTEAGDHEYTITEKAGTAEGITYSKESYTVHVKVVDNGEGKLVATVKEANEARKFTNNFTPNAATATIELTKELTGRDLVDGEFSFELYEGANKLQTVTNKSGKVTFNDISYTAEGEHTYTVKEVKGNNATIAYDASEKQVTVNVTRNGDALQAEVVYPESKNFTNAFTPKATTATIELTKELTGRDLVDGEFSFELYEGTNKLQTVTNKSGKVTFESISYTAEGEHTYTVKEVKGNTPGITYDTAEKQVTVQVTKDGDNLKATVVYPESKVFTNTYSAPSPAKAQISASKILEGRALKDGEFSFTLLDEAGKVLQTKQNAADGSVAFDQISYSQEDAGKTFHYTIKEVIPQSQEKGMTYDQASIEVTVTVTKDGASNTINATVAYGEKTSFINTFVTSEIPPTPPVVEKPEAQLYTIQLHKVNGEGQALAGAVFGLFEKDGSTPVANPYGEGQATATSDANGLVSFVGFEAKDYVVKELTAPEGYQLSTASIAVSATELSAASDLVVDKGNVVNQPFTEIPPTPPTVDKPELKLYSIQLHKVNNEGKPLVGAVFGLFEADGTTPVANPYGEGQATATSDANGLVTFTGLEAKDYVVKELTAPEGYQLSEETISVSSNQLIASTDQVLDQGKVVNKPFTAIPPTPPVVEKPEVKLYTIQLHKVDGEGKDLAGAVFGLFEADGETPVANPYGEGQATATSNDKGLVSFVGFEAKDYVVKELTAPAGYQLSTVSITVSAAELTAATDLVVDKGNVVNQLTPPKGKTPPPSIEKPRKEIPSNPPKGERKEVLPSTGQSMSEGLVAAGLALAVAGSALVYKKREN